MTKDARRNERLPFWDDPIPVQDKKTQALYEEHGLTDLSRTEISAWATAFLKEEDGGDRRAVIAQILMGRELYGSSKTEPDYPITCIWANLFILPEQVIPSLEVCAMVGNMPESESSPTDP